jgi:hypothetical protein
MASREWARQSFEANAQFAISCFSVWDKDERGRMPAEVLPRIGEHFRHTLTPLIEAQFSPPQFGKE